MCIWRVVKKNDGIYKGEERSNITLLACEFISLFIKHMYTYMYMRVSASGFILYIKVYVSEISTLEGRFDDFFIILFCREHIEYKNILIKEYFISRLFK